MGKEKYLERIKYKETTLPGFELLKALQQLHLLHIPFENLDIHLGIPIELSTGKIFDKIVNKKRGGFCYELNGLFYSLLISMDFDARVISARVYNTTEKKYSPAYDHLAIIVSIDKMDYLVDVGFGEFTFSPLKIKPGKIQEDQRGKFKIVKHDGDWLQVNKASGNEWIPEYIFTLQGRQFSEFEAMCQYHQTSPQSHFTKNKICSILTNNGNGRISITNNRLKITNGEQVKEEAINDAAEFEKYLWKYFEMKLL